MRGRSDKVAAMMARKVDLRELKAPGSYLDLHEKLAMDLAREYQREEDPNYVSISWENQERAQKNFNDHGFDYALDLMLKLRERNDGGK